MINIRNICIIAHIDHGKSTLADRLLEITGTVAKDKLQPQLLDSLALERERGITIKLAPVRMSYTLNSALYTLNLIDTPGHVDFSYEVSRALAAVEGAILLVDATQGIQAQTLSHGLAALEQNLTLIPVINKVDLPNADIEKSKQQLMETFGFTEGEILLVSGKTGEGVDALLREVIEKVPPPQVNLESPLRALIFDSFFDPYKGVVAQVKVVDGRVPEEESKLKFLATGALGEVLEKGYFAPALTSSEDLESGQIGYIATGIKEADLVRVGDTITEQDQKSKLKSQNFQTTNGWRGGDPPAGEAGISGVDRKSEFDKDEDAPEIPERQDPWEIQPLPGYKTVKPMVYVGLYPIEQGNFGELKEILNKFRLSDPAFTYEIEHSQALGVGFRCGFLGLLHAEVVQQRLSEEFNLNLLATTPSVEYILGEKPVTNPADLDLSLGGELKEPWVSLKVFTPQEYLGSIMELVAEKRGMFINQTYFGSQVELLYQMPLSEMVTDFYDKLKSVSSGFASLDWEFLEYRVVDGVKVDIMVGGEKVDALSTVVVRGKAESLGRKMVERLKNVLPRQNFEIALQASIGGKIIARENINPFRKDVTAKLYGGDRTRKDKLLDKQKKGKKKMKMIGRVEIPQEAFLSILKS